MMLLNRFPVTALLLLGCALFWSETACAQAVLRDCVVAQQLTQTTDYCSGDGAFSTANSTGISWFKFVAAAYDVNISVSGAGAGSTLANPQVALYSDCSGDEAVGNTVSGNGITSLYKGGLIIGNTYYIEVSGGSNQTGTFKLCLNNYNPVVKPGQDCISASFLCSTGSITQQNVSGAGLYNDEAKGTCISIPGQVSESNSAWYKWQAGNNGTLVFTITPTNTKDDIDWVLYDLGASSDCSGITLSHVIRCKAGAGVDNTGCPKDAIYYKTGLDFRDTDYTEPPGCGLGQNGKLKFLTMQQGHYYALLINNFSSGNNGFTLAFTDQQGKTGTGIFAGPKPAFTYTIAGNCSASPQVTFTNNSQNYNQVKWRFGSGASQDTSVAAGPVTVTYNSAGLKTVILEATGLNGCTVVATQTVRIGIPPPVPVIRPNQAQFCIGDTLVLSTAALDSAHYSWTGPGNFRADGATVKRLVSGPEATGVYKLVVSQFGCASDSGTLVVLPPLSSPAADFTASPPNVNVLYGPVTVTFRNLTTGAVAYTWDFGDGSGSREKDPVHTYDQKGDFLVRLTATGANHCETVVEKTGIVTIRNNNYIFIPNTFTPNGDGHNDFFEVTITNLRSYHIRIFDRWGSPVFESTDIKASWDGRYKEQPVPAGTYFYIIDAIGEQGTTFRKSGYVTLVR